MRYRRRNARTTPLPVSGYGVELALKKTDYIVIDDREATHDFAQKPLGSGAVLNGEDEEVSDLRPLSTSELASLGMKTASYIQESERPMEMLVKLTQDFPRYSASIAAHNVSNEFATEYGQNKAHMGQGGINLLWMNGVQLIERQIEPFALVEMLRRERRLISGVRDLGLNGKQAVSLLGHSAISMVRGDDESTRFDWTDRLEDGRVIIWLNDLEKDARYEGYPKSLHSVCNAAWLGHSPVLTI